MRFGVPYVALSEADLPRVFVKLTSRFRINPDGFQRASVEGVHDDVFVIIQLPEFAVQINHATSPFEQDSPDILE